MHILGRAGSNNYLFVVHLCRFMCLLPNEFLWGYDTVAVIMNLRLLRCPRGTKLPFLHLFKVLECLQQNLVFHF